MDKRVWISVECDCGAEFKVNPPAACFENEGHKNQFSLNCPYCCGEVGYKFYITKEVNHE